MYISYNYMRSLGEVYRERKANFKSATYRLVEENPGITTGDLARQVTTDLGGRQTTPLDTLRAVRVLNGLRREGRVKSKIIFDSQEVTIRAWSPVSEPASKVQK